MRGCSFQGMRVDRWIAISLVLVLGGLVGFNPPVRANCPSRSELIERIDALDSALGEVDRAEARSDTARALTHVKDAFKRVRLPLRTLYPRSTSLMRAYLSQMREAQQSGNNRNLTALSRAFSNSLSSVRGRLTSSDKPLTTVSVESVHLGPGQRGSFSVFVRYPPRGMAGFDVEVRFDPSLITPTGAELARGRGGTRLREKDGSVRFNGILLRSFLSRAPPDVLALGTVNFRTSETGGEKRPLHLRIRELVDRSGDPIPAIGCDGTVSVE